VDEPKISKKNKNDQQQNQQNQIASSEPKHNKKFPE